MTFNEYLKVDAINASGLKLIHKAPVHFWHERVREDKPEEKRSAALDIGNALHALVLEGREDYFVKTIKTTTNKGKDDYAEWIKTLPGDAIILSPKEVEMVEGMAESILSDEEALKLLTQDTDIHLTETTAVFNHGIGAEMTLCKARLDIVKWDQEKVTVVDIKTAQDASPNGFNKAITNFQYYLQAAFYLEAAFSVLNTDPSIEIHTQAFKFLAVEKKPPYAVGIYGISSEYLAQGVREMMEAMKIYRTYRGMKNPWPGYRMPDQGPIILDMPVWARDSLYQSDGF